MDNGKVVIIGEMNNSDGSFESANRVYSINGLCPTIPTGAGGHIPKVVDRESYINEENKKLDCGNEG